MMAIIFAKKSERLKDKHNKIICNETMINRISRILYETGLFDKITLFTKNFSLQCKYCDVLYDHTNGVLINSILYCIKNFKEFFAVGGDMPLIDHDIIKELIDNYNKNTVSVLNHNYYEPLFSIYNYKIYDKMENYINSGGSSVKKFMELNNISYIKKDTIKLKSVNYYDDLIFVNKYLNCI
ncbi:MULTISPECIES: molybdenum cofactor guanylyltransferase [Acidiplasma]|uniref:MobA-like NTP transferase domain-containing protein n=3 Tax=Acidiplasma TaxID=507753 RepID=A0A0Q0WID4_9ARCH|nr:MULTISPECIES: NTP transferase domain-containing protein [Acidiplasma]KJE50003.1 hypothetical protein TZ01_02790 [Acidiplasma sp. MBA-1]KQB35339.1 hypothetical protein AOG55_07055 [Acidiplasma cupricumulans]KQB36641.1 hypothetical protein AOG54_07110 [Acidiplasma aeolicum]WMT55208.1 MAG: hypothetical protein RE470_00840 [Acidiplasma sp.]